MQEKIYLNANDNANLLTIISYLLSINSHIILHTSYFLPHTSDLLLLIHIQWGSSWEGDVVGFVEEA